MPRVTASPDTGRRGAQWTSLYLGIGFTALATLLLMLALARILAAVFYRDVALVMVPVATLGLGAGGIFSYFVVERTANLFAELGRLTFVNGVTIVLLLWFLLSRHGDLAVADLILVALASAVPFFFAGTVLSIAMSEAIERIHRAWFFHLVGPAAGLVLAVPFFNLFGAPNTMIGAGVVYGACSAIWFNRGGEDKLRALSVLVALMLVALMGVNGINHIFGVRWSAGERLPEELYSRWNTYSRVSVSAADSEQDASGLILRVDGEVAVPAATTEVQQAPGLLETAEAAPFLLRPGARTLIIGAGGGMEVARALASGSRDVTAIESNPIIANRIMRDRLVEETGGLFTRPEVHVVTGDPRSSLRQLEGRYGVVQLTLPATAAAVRDGAGLLIPDEWRTLEAFAGYAGRVDDDGVLAISVWDTGASPVLRTLAQVLSARAPSPFGGPGWVKPDVATIVLREPGAPIQRTSGSGIGRITFVTGRRAFSGEDVARVRAVVDRSDVEALYLPGMPPSNPYAEMILAEDMVPYQQVHPGFVLPSTTDPPFPRAASFGGDWNTLWSGGPARPILVLTYASIALGVVFVAVLIALPARWIVPGGAAAWLVCAAPVGVVAAMVLVGEMHPLGSLLGNPTMEWTVVAVTMLSSAGIGSLAQPKLFRLLDREALAWFAAASIIFVMFFSVPAVLYLLNAAQGFGIVLRVFTAIVLAGGPAFLIGLLLPILMRRAHTGNRLAVPWVWSVLVAAMATGSLASRLVAIYSGFGNIWPQLAGIYVVMCVLYVWQVLRGRRPQGSTP